MTTFSKFFADRARNLTCKDLLHPEFERCSSYHWYMLRTSTIKTLKYLGPIFLIPFVVNFRSATFDEWIEKTVTYLKMSFGISGMVSLAFATHCFLYKLLKEIRYYNMTGIPMAIGLISFVNYFPPKFVNMQFLFLNNLMVQAMLRTTDYPMLTMVRESRIFSTVLFMAFSSLIMGLMALTKGEKHRYWYAQNFEVKKPESDSDDTINDKIDLLKDLIYKQMMHTVKVALLMSSIKVISNSFKLLLKRRIFAFLLTIIRNFDYKLLGFFVMYGTSFQVLNFLLHELGSKKKPHRKSFLAGLIAGSAFYISPRYFLFTYALTAVIELLMTFFLNKSKIAILMKKFPWQKIFFCISVPTFVHWRIVHPWMIPKLMDKLMDIFGVRRLAIGSQSYAKHILGI